MQRLISWVKVELAPQAPTARAYLTLCFLAGLHFVLNFVRDLNVPTFITAVLGTLLVSVLAIRVYRWHRQQQKEAGRR